MLFRVIWSFGTRIGYPSISAVLECRNGSVWSYGVEFGVETKNWGPKLLKLWNFDKELTLVNIWGSEAQIEIPRVPLVSGGDSKSRMSLGWIFRRSVWVSNFFGVKLVSWHLIEFRVKESSNSNSDGSIESGTSNLVGVHI